MMSVGGLEEAEGILFCIIIQCIDRHYVKILIYAYIFLALNCDYNQHNTVSINSN